jgi:hypothetical protein
MEEKFNCIGIIYRPESKHKVKIESDKNRGGW